MLVEAAPEEDIINEFGDDENKIKIISIEKYHVVLALTDKNVFTVYKMDTVGIFSVSLSLTLSEKCHLMQSLDFEKCFKVYFGVEDGNIYIISLSKIFDKLLEGKQLNVHPASHKVRALFAESSLKILVSLGSFYEIALVNAVSDTLVSHYKLKDFFPSLLEIDPALKILYLAGVDYEIKRFEFKLSGLSSMREVKRININENCVSSMKLFDKGEKIITGFQSGSIHIYNTMDRKSEYISLLRHDSSIILLHVVKNEKLISMSSDGFLTIWDLQHQRTPIKSWEYSPVCSQCEKSFFPKISIIPKNDECTLNRGHCFVCGQSICIEHLNNCALSTFHGFEKPVKICDRCIISTNCSIPISPNFNFPSQICSVDLNTINHHLFVSGINTPIKCFNLTQKIEF